MKVDNDEKRAELTARISTAVLEVLDRHGREYFDTCPKSQILVNQIDERIRQAVKRFSRE